MQKKIWLGCLFALAFSAKAEAVPDPRDSVILESKTIAAIAGTGGGVRVKVWITNKDSLTYLTLPLVETSLSGGAYMTLSRPRTFSGVVAPLTGTLRFITAVNFSKYNSSSPDSFLVGAGFDPANPATIEPPNATRKPIWEIKFDTATLMGPAGTVEFDSGRVVLSLMFTNTAPADFPVNFVKSTVTVIPPCPAYDFRATLEHFGPATRGSWRFVRIQCNNAGSCAAAATLVWKAPSQAAALFGYGVAHPTAGGASQPVPASIDANARTVSWSFPQIAAGQGFYLWARYQIPCGLATGTPLLTTVRAEPVDFDLDSTTNVDTLRKITAAGGSPCNMLERGGASGEGQRIAAAVAYGEIFGNDAIDTLTMVILFQNVGDAITSDVLVRDSLDVNLNEATFDSAGASHPFSFGVSGNELSWNLDNINLPDSGADPTGNVGFVAFRIRADGGLPEGTVIQSKALLNFDGGPTFVTPPVAVPICLLPPGDINGDSNLSPADVVLMLNCVFLSSGNCTACADHNCDGNLSPADVVTELNAVFLTAPIECL